MATRVDLNGIKDQIQTVLIAANTTTASPIDLSSGLSQRVQRVLKIHPAMINPQASFFPLVTCFISEKSINAEDIAGSQLNSKRTAKVSIEVVGAVWNQNFTADDEDPADEDINYLMENVELVLRGDPSLTSKVKWQKPSSTEYYNAGLDEQTHLRFGILKLEGTVFY